MCWPRPPRWRSMSARQDARIRVHARGDVRDRQAGLRGFLLGARHRQEPRLALDQQVVRLLVAIRAVRAVARDVADDDARLGGGQRRVREPEPRGGAGREVLHDDVRVRADQVPEDRLRIRVLDVERQAFLRPVRPHEVRREAAHALVVAAREVAGAGPLDLDHARAHVGQLPRGERRGDRVFERDDGDAFQRAHRRARYRRTAVASIVRHPSWSRVHRRTDLPSGCGAPQTKNGLRSKTGRTARNA